MIEVHRLPDIERDGAITLRRPRDGPQVAVIAVRGGIQTLAVAAVHPRRLVRLARTEPDLAREQQLAATEGHRRVRALDGVLVVAADAHVSKPHLSCVGVEPLRADRHGGRRVETRTAPA